MEVPHSGFHSHFPKVEGGYMCRGRQEGQKSQVPILQRKLQCKSRPDGS